MLLTSENLKSIKLKTKKVCLTKAEAEIYVGLLPASLVKEARASNISDPESKEAESFGYRMVLACVVDSNNKPVFESTDDFLGLPPAIQEEILNAVCDYNGLSETGKDKLEKN